MNHCFCCGYPRADGIQTHARDCEWCTLAQRVAQIEKHQADIFETIGKLCGFLMKVIDGTSEAIPDTQRSGAQQCEHGHPVNSGFCGRCWQFGRNEAADPGEPHADPGAAEPPGAAHAGADAAPGRPERT